MATPPPPGPELADAVRDVLDGRFAEVRREVREQLDWTAFGYPDDVSDQSAYRGRTLEQLRRLGQTDHARWGLTVDQGGTGEPGKSVTAIEMLGHLDLSLFVKAGVQFGLYGGAVANLGTERHHREHLPGMLDVSVPGCFAMTERGHGSDVQSLETTATYDADSDEIVVHSPMPSAMKEYIGNAAQDARMAAVFARLVVAGEDHGVHCILVPVRDADGGPLPGVTIGDCGPKAGLPGVDNGTLAFDHVRVPRLNLLNRYGTVDDDGRYHSPIDNPNKRFFTMLGTLVRGRISVGGAAGSATRSALALAVRYALERRQFAAPGGGDEVLLLDYRVHQRKLLPALARSYALALAQNDLVAVMHDTHGGGPAQDDEVQRELETRSAGIKALTTAHATATIQTCREACGGAGYLTENRLVRLKADTDVFTTFEGDNTVLLQLVAKGMLTQFSDAFRELGTVETVVFGARQFAGSVIERSTGASLIQRLIAGSPGRDADDALLDRGGQLDLFEDRERHLTETLAMRLRKVSEADDAFAAFNATQDHLVRAAVAHVERIVLESFVTAIDDCENRDAAVLLGRVCDLFVLSTIEADRAWFMEHGRINARQAKALQVQVNRVCADLRPYAATLVDAFGIPDSWLDVPMLRHA
jgi:acyl-CoA oxidase